MRFFGGSRLFEKQCPCCGASRKDDKMYLCGSPIGLSSPTLRFQSAFCKSISNWLNRVTGGGNGCVQ